MRAVAVEVLVRVLGDRLAPARAAGEVRMADVDAAVCSSRRVGRREVGVAGRVDAEEIREQGVGWRVESAEPHHGEYEKGRTYVSITYASTPSPPCPSNSYRLKVPNESGSRCEMRARPWACTSSAAWFPPTTIQFHYEAGE